MGVREAWGRRGNAATVWVTPSMNLCEPVAAVNHEPRLVRLHRGSGGVECRSAWRRVTRCRTARVAAGVFLSESPRPQEGLAPF